MGAWGSGPFDNDDAADWAYELEESDGTDIVVSTLGAIDPDSYLEAAECATALAAAEVVAALKGEPLETLPAEVAAWVIDHPTEVDDELQGLALIAIHRIETESELRDLWEESDELEPWLATLDDLKARLGSP